MCPSTLIIVVCYNTTIISESILYALMAYGQVFFCCTATTLDIVVHYDTTIRLEFVRYMLAAIRLEFVRYLFIIFC